MDITISDGVVSGKNILPRSDEKRVAKQFIKWAGGKGQLLGYIREIYPVGLGKDITKYAEPFVGGGAVLFDILSKYELDEIYISDINAELINTYLAIRDDVSGLIGILSSLQNDYLSMSEEERRSYYYKRRNRFNELKANGDRSLNLEAAALFIFLNRTCFNGLYRVNRKNLFNVPFGTYKNPKICDIENLTAVSKALSNVTIVCDDYRKSFSFIDEKTFVYFDPPYRPLNATSSFNSYADKDFDDVEQENLAKFVQELGRKGARVVVSNSDPKNVNPEDDFFDVLYADQLIHRIFASRMINSNPNLRGKVSELLICNF